MTYMVLETHKSYCVVLDEKGRFLKAANFRYETGQVLEKIVELTGENEKKRISFRAISAFAAVAACFVFIFAAFFNRTPAVYGTVYLSINPEIRADVSENGTVVALFPQNDDGAILLDGYHGKKKSIEKVANELVDRAVAQGFLSAGGAVMIQIDAPDEAWFQETGITLRQNLSKFAEERLSVTIAIQDYAQTTPATTTPPATTPPPTTPATTTPPATTPLATTPLATTPTATTPKATTPARISAQQALAIALAHAGVNAADAKEVEIEWEEDDGVWFYEVEFSAGNVEYEYEIHGFSGAILEYDAETDDD